MDATILSSLMSCGYLTNLRFNENLQSSGGKSNSIECGSIVHTFLEYYYGSIIKGISKSDALDEGIKQAKLYINGCPICLSLDADFVGMPECHHKNGEFVGVKNTPQKSEKSKIGWEHALDTCLQYLAHYKSDAWVPLEAEKTLGEIIYQDDNLVVLWKAKFDLIVDTNQSILPIDHKTMSQRRDTLSLNNQFIGQCILSKSRNMVVNKIGFQTSLKPSEKFERAMMSYSAARLNEWQNKIVPYWANKLVEYTQTGNWIQNFTHCENKFGTCHMKEICESDPNMREEVKKLNFVHGKSWDVSND